MSALPDSARPYSCVVSRAIESWASSDAARASMRTNRARDTQPELALRCAVHALGMRYRVSVRPLQAVRRIADPVFTRVKVAVFLDGCFWPRAGRSMEANDQPSCFSRPGMMSLEA